MRVEFEAGEERWRRMTMAGLDVSLRDWVVGGLIDIATQTEAAPSLDGPREARKMPHGRLVVRRRGR